MSALESVLDLDGQIPWDATDHTAPPVPAIGLVLRSDKTRRQMLDELPEPRRTAKLDECQSYGIPLDERDEIRWEIHRPRKDSSFFARMSFAKWIAYEASKMPAGYAPVRLDQMELTRRGLNSESRDDAIRSALAAGTSVAALVAETGLSRARIYQIRDGRR